MGKESLRFVVCLPSLRLKTGDPWQISPDNKRGKNSSFETCANAGCVIVHYFHQIKTTGTWYWNDDFHFPSLYNIIINGDNVLCTYVFTNNDVSFFVVALITLSFYDGVEICSRTISSALPLK